MRYHIAADMAGLSLEAMAREIEGIATCLWSAAVELTLPLNATKGSKLTKDGTKLCNGMAFNSPAVHFWPRIMGGMPSSLP